MTDNGPDAPLPKSALVRDSRRVLEALERAARLARLRREMWDRFYEEEAAERAAAPAPPADDR